MVHRACTPRMSLYVLHMGDVVVVEGDERREHVPCVADSVYTARRRHGMNAMNRTNWCVGDSLKTTATPALSHTH